MKSQLSILLLCACFSLAIQAAPWISDLGNGRYKNPVLFADYSDPDIIKVGDDFYMVASSATTQVSFHPSGIKDKAGLVVMGQTWAYLAFYQSECGRGRPQSVRF